MGQPSHWTYRSFDATDDLQQGDIIRRSPALTMTDIHFACNRGGEIGIGVGDLIGFRVEEE